MRRSELIQAIAGVVGIVGFFGIAGWTETGNGLVASIVLMAVGAAMYLAAERRSYDRR